MLLVQIGFFLAAIWRSIQGCTLRDWAIDMVGNDEHPLAIVMGSVQPDWIIQSLPAGDNAALQQQSTSYFSQ